MDALMRFNDSMQYIEEHLDKEMDIGKAAAIASMSKYHFQRMFSLLSGMPVGEYIRNRRLTRAAEELVFSNKKVIDIAARYGYETPEAFSKAFRKAHQMSPTEARTASKAFKAYPRLVFQIQLKGAIEMNYKIVEKEAFKAIGKDIKVSLKNGENLRKIPAFWNETEQSGFDQELSGIAGNMGLLGICISDQKDTMTYAIAVEKKGDELPEGYSEYDIPASTYAVFEAIGPMPDAIQEVWKRIYSEWLPSTGYQQTGNPELEVYPDLDPASPSFRSEVWISVKRK